MAAGQYTEADWARLAEIEEEFRVIRAEEIDLARQRSPIRALVRSLRTRRASE